MKNKKNLIILILSLILCVLVVLAIIIYKEKNENSEVTFTYDIFNYSLYDNNNYFISSNYDNNYIYIKSYNEYLDVINNFVNWKSMVIYEYKLYVDSIETDDEIKQSMLDSYFSNFDILYNEYLKYDDSYFDNNDLLMVEKNNYGAFSHDTLDSICINNNTLNLHISEETTGFLPYYNSNILFINIEKKYVKSINNISLDIKSNYHNDDIILKKPVIYLYPTRKQNISVKFKYPEHLLIHYPEYNNRWNVIAYPDGTLIDLNTDTKLYSLYYEAKSIMKFDINEDGYCVSGQDITKFLEEKLDILGLNYKEKEEFIIYWLPILKQNKYNYIRFATSDEINKNTPIVVSPKPDTMIRVLMLYKPLDKPIKTKGQKLETPIRNGFTFVEWGGSVLN